MKENGAENMINIHKIDDTKTPTTNRTAWFNDRRLEIQDFEQKFQ